MRADLVERLVLQLAEADRDVGDLHAGVVDVVLDLDLASEEPQQAAEGVAERGVAQVPDVRRLVRIDRGVLDDGLARRRADGAPGRRRSQPARRARPAIEEEVDVAVRRRLDAGDAVDRAERGGDLLRDRARRLAQPARQLEGERDGEIAEGARGGRLRPESRPAPDRRAECRRGGRRPRPCGRGRVCWIGRIMNQRSS